MKNLNGSEKIEVKTLVRVLPVMGGKEYWFRVEGREDFEIVAVLS